MKYCVIKDTTRPIAQGEDEELLKKQALENMLDGKYLTLEDIEILTEEEHKARKALEIVPIAELTTDEKITAMAKELVIVQAKLEASQEALDYIIMGGM